MSTLFTITIGTEFDRHGEALTPENLRTAKNWAAQTIGEAFGGATITEGEGVFISESGATVREQCIVFTTVTDIEGADKLVKVIAQKLKSTLRQESVLVISQPIDSQFI